MQRATYRALCHSYSDTAAAIVREISKAGNRLRRCYCEQIFHSPRNKRRNRGCPAQSACLAVVMDPFLLPFAFFCSEKDSTAAFSPLIWRVELAGPVPLGGLFLSHVTSRSLVRTSDWFNPEVGEYPADGEEIIGARHAINCVQAAGPAK